MDAPYLRLDRHSQPWPHSFAVGPRVSLEITRGRAQQRVRAVRGRVFLIGTAHDCDLVLGDLAFPEAYAYLFVDGERVSIRRLGEGPELLVCGEAAETADLFHGDLLTFGPFELRLTIDAPPRRHHSHSEEPHLDERASLADLDGEAHEAIDEVQLLLGEIRRELASSAAVLRLYETPSQDQAGKRQRASA
jgi:hypothetical protein